MKNGRTVAHGSAPPEDEAPREGAAARVVSPSGTSRRPYLIALGAAALLSTVLILAGCGGTEPAQGSGAQPVSRSEGSGGGTPSDYEAATRDDEEFNRIFRHEFANVDGVRMHYVVGGEGPPLVLLHGWPQTWYEWSEVMPALAERHTMIAVDLPGLGDSEGEPSGYDKATLAPYVHGLVSEKLGYDRVGLVGHDMGAGVGYQYAAQYPDEVEGFAFMEYVLPGPATPKTGPLSLSWHFGFNATPGLPEEVVADDVRVYLDWFYDNFAAEPDAVAEGAVDEFVRTYSEPSKLAAGFGLYRTLPQDEEDNRASAEPVLDMPVLVMAAMEGPGGEAARQLELGSVRPVAPDARAVGVPEAGHWIAEENPEFLSEELLRFFDEGAS